jgi:tetratricopeptide (TPR) repeat protein
VETASGGAAIILSRAKLHLDHGNWAEALADLDRFDLLTAEDPRTTGGLRGKALNLARQWGNALEALNAHLKWWPEDVDALLERAIARAESGDSGATEDFRSALGAIEVADPGKVLLAADAIQSFEGSQSAAEFIADCLVGRGAEPALAERAIALYLELGQFDDALKQIDLLTAIAPRKEPCLARRAKVLEQAGCLDEAREQWADVRDRILALPNLERGSPLLKDVFAEAQAALSEPSAITVIAPPAPSQPQPRPKPAT